MERSQLLDYRTTVLSEGLKLSEDTVERAVDIQKRYQRQGLLREMSVL